MQGGGHKGLCRILFMTFKKVKSDFRPDRLPPNIGGPTLHEIKPLYMKEDPSQINLPLQSRSRTYILFEKNQMMYHWYAHCCTHAFRVLASNMKPVLEQESLFFFIDTDKEGVVEKIMG